MVLRDLLVHGGSYYFDVTRPDFSGPLAIAGLFCVATIYVIVTPSLWTSYYFLRFGFGLIVGSLEMNIVRNESRHVLKCYCTGGPG